MNVLLITDKLITGGAEIYFCKLENKLSDYHAMVYTAAGSGELYKNIKHKERFVELSKSNHLLNMWRIRKIIREKNIDLIHANSLRVVLLLLMIRMSIFRAFQCIYTKHNVTILERKMPSLFTILLNYFVTRIITVSHYERENLIALGVYNQKITTIYNGVDLHQFQFHPKRGSAVFKVGILARMSEEKNHSFFIEIANQLRDESHIEFYAAGNGPEYKAIKEKIRDLNLSHKIKLLGNVNHPEEFIKEMDVLLLTSKREVFPMVILEAMAVGTPIISINRGGIKEAVINNKTGFVITEHSVEAFCSKILILEQDRSLRIKLVKTARSKVIQDFSLDSMVNLTYKEYCK
jgi:glycosyltransferase involved in cell wall biosynthesis